MKKRQEEYKTIYDKEKDRATKAEVMYMCDSIVRFMTIKLMLPVIKKTLIPFLFCIIVS